jgi:hypothetical protein
MLPWNPCADAGHIVSWNPQELDWRSKCLDVNSAAGIVAMSDIGGYGPIIIATMWAETGITLLFVCLRLYTRIRINHTVGWDDYLISLSSVSVL